MREAGVELVLNDDGTSHLDGIGLVIKSPGVPQTAPVIEVARERGIPVIGELEIAWRSLNNPFVAVTGTNGKTTVVEWLGHVWREAGMPVVVAGNVGTPLSSLPSTIDEYATVICECSSFQLEDSAAFAPEVAVLLNVTPDHLDRHGTLDAYRDAKLRIFAGQSATDYSIFDADLVPFAASDRPGSGATIAYGVSACAEGGCLVRLRNEVIEVDGMALVPVSELALSGEHNVRNAMAVAAAALCGGVPARGDRPRPAHLRRRPASARARRRDRRGRLRERLEGDQRRRRPGRARRLRRCPDPRDPRWQPQGRLLRRPLSGRGGELPVGLSDR